MVDTKAEFEKWLKAGNSEKFAPSFIMSNIEQVSERAVGKSITKIGFFQITDYRLFNQIRDKIAKSETFRRTHKDLHKKFSWIGDYYSQFLKEHENKNILTVETQPKPLIEMQSTTTIRKTIENEQAIEKKTIIEAVKIVLSENSPLTIKEIYSAIIARGLYDFKSATPLSVLGIEVRGHCVDVELPSRVGYAKLFVIAGKTESGALLYALAGQTCSDTAKKGVAIVVESVEDPNKKIPPKKAVTSLDWNEQIATDFQNWIIQQGKAEATARSYRSAMNFIVKTFSKEWILAKKQENAILGLKNFYNLIKNNENFIASNKAMHNAYSASIKAFYLFLSKATENTVFKKQCDETNSAEKIWDWNGNNDSIDAKPVMIRTKLNGEVSVKSWREALRYLYEYVLKNYPAADLVSQKLCALDPSGMLRPYKLTNGLFIETHYSTKDVMAKCKRLILSCGENLSNVELIFQKKNDKQTYDNDTSGIAPKTYNVAQIDEQTKEICLKKIKASNLNGYKITSENVSEMGTKVASLKRLLKDCNEVIELEDDCWVHKDAFCDLDEAKSSFETIIKRHIGSLGLSTKPIFYDAVKLECSMFLNDNDFCDEDKIYRLASQLFKEKFCFYANFFISEIGENEIKSAADIGIRIARQNGGFVSKIEIESVFKQLKISQNASQALGIYNGKNDFAIYAEDEYLHFPTAEITSKQVEIVRNEIDKLFASSPEEHFIILRDIDESWFTTLPPLPNGKEWSLLLLQEVLGQMPEVGYSSIKCLSSQDKTTIHAAIVPSNSHIKTFADIVWLYLEGKGKFPQEYAAEQLRQILKESGMISGQELIFTMPKALNDYRFAWINNNATVKIRG